MGKEFTALRNSGDFPWLQGYSFKIVRAALQNGGNSYPEGKPVKTSVVHECGKWYATACYKVDLPPRAEPELVAAMTVTVARWPWSIPMAPGRSTGNLRPTC